MIKNIKRYIRKGIISISLVLATTASLVGCGTKDSTGNGSESEETKKLATINIADTGTSIIDDPLIALADENGYFEEYGLTPTHMTVDFGTRMESIAIGKVDTTYAGVIPPLSYGAQGSDVTIFGGTLSGGMYVICRTEDVEELSDLENWKGKTLGVFKLSTSEMVAKYALEQQYGYSAEEDLDIKIMDDYPNIVLGVEKGEIDLGFVGPNYLENAEDMGITILFPLTTLQKDYVCCRQTAYAPSIEENRDSYVAYLKGQIRAYKDYVEDEEGTIATLVEGSGETEDYVISYVYDKETNGDKTYNPDPNYNGTLSTYNVLLKWDYIEQGVELYEFFDISIYADALKEIIEEFPEEQFYKDMWTYFLENNSDYPDFQETYGNYLDN